MRQMRGKITLLSTDFNFRFVFFCKGLERLVGFLYEIQDIE